MRTIIALPILLYSFLSSANSTPLSSGLYHLTWVYGNENNYKTVTGVVSDISKKGGAIIFS